MNKVLNETEINQKDSLGRKQGLWRVLTLDGKKILIETYYVNGKKHGLHMEYHPDGNMSWLRRGYYVNDNREGLWRIWYPKGQVKWANGQLNYSWYYVGGNEEGEHIKYEY